MDNDDDGEDNLEACSCYQQQRREIIRLTASVCLRTVAANLFDLRRCGMFSESLERGHLAGGPECCNRTQFCISDSTLLCV